MIIGWYLTITHTQCVPVLIDDIYPRLADRIALCFQTPNMAEMPTCGVNGRGRREQSLKLHQ